MIRSRIIATGSYAPPKVLTNFDLEKMVETTDEWIISRSGIRERRIVETNVSTSDLGTQAALRALNAAGLSPEDLDFIITGTNSPDMFFPCTGCFIQAKIGAKKAAAFDVSAGCTSFIHALSLADKFIKEDPSRKVMVLGAEIMSKVTDWTDRATCVLFGDGAGAIILAGEEGERGVLSTHLHSDGSLWELLYMPGGGSANPSSYETVDKRMHYIKMAGNQLFKVAVRALADVSQEALKFNGLKSEDIDIMIPHQANTRIIEAAAKLIGFPMEKVFLNIEKYGNTSSATIPIAMDEVQREGKVKAGDLMLLCSFGTGVTWGSAVIRW
ncbi:MAG: beta-ketoacyl-ACP synthase III [Deltaproteobacteria bacterium]|nr:beta-ketoacyl-ACP synthase III [Deltaproteobacteria bacterium]MDO9211540.1 beta-ketoacyl-ACP synthase III [Deltaproteobacteria bacterium]